MQLRVRSEGCWVMTIGCLLRTENRARPYIYSIPPYVDPQPWITPR